MTVEKTLTEVRHALSLALISVDKVQMPLSMASGRGGWKGQFSPERSRELAKRALTELDAGMVELAKVREDLAALIAEDRVTTTTPAVTVQPCAYAVSAVPSDYRWAKDFTITVESKGWYDRQEWWVVKNVGYYLATDGSWSPYESADRWDLETALELAREHAPKLRYGTWTVANALAQYTEANQ